MVLIAAKMLGMKVLTASQKQYDLYCCSQCTLSALKVWFSSTGQEFIYFIATHLYLKMRDLQINVIQIRLEPSM